MKQLMILIKNEYDKRRGSYWMPVWIIAGVTVLVLLMVLGALIGNWDNIRIGFMNMAFDFEDIQDGVRVAAYGTMLMMSFVFALFMLLNTQSSLSKEKELGCELFYRCQPVSVWRITGVKYLMHTYAGSLLLLGLGLIMAVVTAVVSACTVGGFYPGQALYGTILGWFTYLKICLVFGSLYYLFSAAFKNNALIKGTALLGVTELVFFLIEQLFHRTILMPDIFRNLFALLGNLNVDSTLNIAEVLGDPRLFIALLFAAAAYAGATVIYQYKPCEA